MKRSEFMLRGIKNLLKMSLNPLEFRFVFPGETVKREDVFVVEFDEEILGYDINEIDRIVVESVILAMSGKKSKTSSEKYFFTNKYLSSLVLKELRDRYRY